MNTPPLRLNAEGSDAHPSLRAMLRQARDAVPSETRLLALSDALERALAVDADAAANSKLRLLNDVVLPAAETQSGTTPSKLHVRVLAVGMAIATLLGAWLWVQQQLPSAPPAKTAAPLITPATHTEPKSTRETAGNAAVSQAPPTAALELAKSTATPAPDRRRTRVMKHSAGTAREAVRAAEEDEVGLLLRARRVLEAAPERALGLLREHETSFANGNFAEEREALVIEAQHRAGDTTLAIARYARFARRYPRSAYLERLSALLRHEGEPTRP